MQPINNLNEKRLNKKLKKEHVAAPCVLIALKIYFLEFLIRCHRIHSKIIFYNIFSFFYAAPFLCKNILGDLSK